MKTTLQILLFIFSSYQVIGQKQDLVVVINPAESRNDLSQPDILNSSQTPVIPDLEFTRNMYTYKLGNKPFIYPTTVLIVRIFNKTTRKLMKLGDVDRSIQVKVTIDGTTKTISPSSISELDMTDFNVFLDNAFNGVSLKHNSEVTVQVLLSNGNFTLDNSSYQGKYFVSNYSLYQAFETNIGGFWLPTLQFSSNLKSTTDGVPFASLPIGLAWGGKYTSKKGRYFGASVMGNWLIYTQPENSNPATSNSFNLQGLTTGVILDVNDVITIGYAYGFNLRSGSKNPGNMFVLGFGSKAINFLKKDKR